MHQYWKRIHTITMTATRRKQKHALANPNETLRFRSLAGTLIFLGNFVLPQAVLEVSLMQQRLAKLTLSNLIDANVMTGKLRNLLFVIRFRRTLKFTQVSLVTFSDASHTEEKGYSQTGFITGIYAKDGCGEGSAFH